MKTYDLVSSKDHVTEQAIANSATRLVPSGTILVVVRSGVLAHTIPVGVTRQPSTFNQDIKAIIPGPELDAEYAAFFLKSLQDEIVRKGVKRGATVHSLDADYLSGIKIPIPHLAEQQHAVSMLKALLAEVEIALLANRSQLAEIKRMPAKILTRILGA